MQNAKSCTYHTFCLGKEKHISRDFIDTYFCNGFANRYPHLRSFREKLNKRHFIYRIFVHSFNKILFPAKKRSRTIEQSINKVERSKKNLKSFILYPVLRLSTLSSRLTFVRRIRPSPWTRLSLSITTSQFPEKRSVW